MEAGTTAEAQGNVSVPTAMEEVHQGVKEVAVNPAQVGLSVAKENPQATIAAAATTVATTAATAEGKAILVIAEGKPGILLNKKKPRPLDWPGLFIRWNKILSRHRNALRLSVNLNDICPTGNVTQVNRKLPLNPDQWPLANQSSFQ